MDVRRSSGSSRKLGFVRALAIIGAAAVFAGCEKPLPPIGDLLYVKGGTFRMGSSKAENIDGPAHIVQVSGFYIKKHEVTNTEAADVFNWALKQGYIKADAESVVNLRGDPEELLDVDNVFCHIRYKDGKLFIESGREDLPCRLITWHGSAAYCNYRSLMENLDPCYNLSGWECDFTKSGYRLPTEAEWEYAASGGNKSKGYVYAGSNDVNEVAWCVENSNDDIHPVGVLKPNELGLYDMSGNVFEWCNDWFGIDYYARSSGSDPRGPSSGTSRVLRGGGYLVAPAVCEVDYRSSLPLGYRSFKMSYGLRTVRRAG